MMKVRPMGMPVYHRLVRMLVGVAMRHYAVMRMCVMTVIMPMAVLMFLSFMFMLVRVLFVKQQQQRPDQNGSGCYVYRSNALAKDNDRENYTKERIGCEEHLTAGGADVLRRGDIEYNARAVADDSYRQRCRCGQQRPGEFIRTQTDRKVHGARNDSLP